MTDSIDSIDATEATDSTDLTDVTDVQTRLTLRRYDRTAINLNK